MKGARWALLKNESDLNAAQRARLEYIANTNETLWTAYKLKERLGMILRQGRGCPRPCCASGPRTHPCAASRNSQNSERRSHGATSTSDKARNLAHFVIRASWKRTWPVPCTIFSR
ncbi:transposase [Bifidobacterium breve]|uniref:transposase n=1 Tax=Bifidobacterium breve TaxID=1685 RepID=UPI003B9B2D9F